MQLWIVAWTATQCCFAHFISWYYVCDYHTRIDWCIWSVLVCLISFSAKSIILTTCILFSQRRLLYWLLSILEIHQTNCPLFCKDRPALKNVAAVGAMWGQHALLFPSGLCLSASSLATLICMPWWESWESYVTEDLSCYKSRHCSRTTSQLPNVTQTAWGCCIVKFQNGKIANRNKPWLVQIKCRLLHLF